MFCGFQHLLDSYMSKFGKMCPNLMNFIDCHLFVVSIFLCFYHELLYIQFVVFVY